MTETWNILYDNAAKVPYAVQGVNWVSYDDEDSLSDKVQFALQRNVTGIMVWSIETDDFRAKCQDQDYPLIRSINKALGRYVSAPIITTPGIPGMFLLSIRRVHVG